MPQASIVIPCYNASAYIAQTLESARRQTMEDLEIICVDDGSTDNTATILQKQAAEDTRIHIFTQKNAGEGPARELGRIKATGKWLYFLDADDLMERTLLEEACAQGEKTRADIVIFKTRELDNQTGELRPFHWSFVYDWLIDTHDMSTREKKAILEDPAQALAHITLDGVPYVFCPREHPERIFNSFQNWVHNKLFRKSFVDARGLYFQQVHRTADLLFTCRALAEADRISLLPKELHQYRVNNANSALFTSDAYPLDFYEAFLELRRALETKGLWTLYRDSFCNWAQEGVSMNLARARSFESFMAIVHCMRDEKGLAKLGFLQSSRASAINPDRWDRCYALLHNSTEELLFLYFALERVQKTAAETEASRMRKSLQKLYDSRALRLGEAAIPLVDKPIIQWAIRVFSLHQAFHVRRSANDKQ